MRQPDYVKLAVMVITALIFIAVLAPLVVIVIVSFSPTSQAIIPPSGLSLRWYARVLADENIIDGFRWSVVLATLSSLIAVVTGTCAAVALDRGYLPGKAFFDGILLSPMVFPTLVLGVSVLVYLQSFQVGVFTRLCLTHALLGVPFVIRMVSASLQMFDRRIEEAGRVHGASALKTFFLLVIPSIRPGMAAGGIFAFISSFGEVNATIFLTGPGVTTLPIYIFSELQFGVGQIGIAAVSTIQIVLIALSVVAIDRFLGVSFLPIRARQKPSH